MTDSIDNRYTIHYLQNSTRCVILILTIWHTNLKARKPCLQARCGGRQDAY
jgi:hypothetical protein